MQDMYLWLGNRFTSEFTDLSLATMCAAKASELVGIALKTMAPKARRSAMEFSKKMKDNRRRGRKRIWPDDDDERSY